MQRSDEAGSAPVDAREYSYERGPIGPRFARNIAVETPVNILFGGVPFAVMMTTPTDLEDFATGFALTEGVVERRGDIRAIEIARAAEGIKVNIALASDRMSAHLARGRAISGNRARSALMAIICAGSSRASGNAMSRARVIGKGRWVS